MTVTAPSTSKLCWRSPYVSSRNQNAPIARAIPSGTLMKKTHCQPGPSVSRPEITTPAVAPEAEIAPQMPRALVRAGPSSKVAVRIDSAADAVSAAPKPWAPRATTRTPSVVDRPATREAPAKMMIPLANTFRRPSRSAARPPRSRNPPRKIP